MNNSVLRRLTSRISLRSVSVSLIVNAYLVACLALTAVVLLCCLTFARTCAGARNAVLVIAARSKSLGEELQRLLISETDLEQQTQHSRTNANCLNPQVRAVFLGSSTHHWGEKSTVAGWAPSNHSSPTSRTRVWGSSHSVVRRK